MKKGEPLGGGPRARVHKSDYHRVTNGALTNGALREQFSELQLQLQQQLKLREWFPQDPISQGPISDSLAEGRPYLPNYT